MKTIYFILGQTSTGKTARAAKLAREIDGELINCDSRQIYKLLNIITGKSDNPPDIPMHMVDRVDPSVRYSAHEYAIETKKVIDEIASRGKTPIIVGGTGLYAYYLLHLNPNHVTTTLLDQIDNVRIDSLSIPELEHQISLRDPHALDKMNTSDRANPHRLGSSLKKLMDPAYVPPLSPTVTLADDAAIKITILLHEDLDHMQTLISERVKYRIEHGAVEESRKLLDKGYDPNMPGLRTLGYTQIFAYLRGECTLEEATRLWVDKECHYAKRQKTYLKKYFRQAAVHLL